MNTTFWSRRRFLTVAAATTAATSIPFATTAQVYAATAATGDTPSLPSLPDTPAARPSPRGRRAARQ
ncbi:hypothetical protein ACFQZ0_21310 [Streptomyces erythrogriseus]